MNDREKVMKGLDCHIKVPDECLDCPYVNQHGCRHILCGDTMDLLKEKKWHVFHRNEDGRMDVECVPNNHEAILWYRKYSGDMSVTVWDDDMWAEFACDADGEDFEDGDAWFELPDPPDRQS